jgi:recombinational DNA repair ATPase RecF
MHRSLVERRLIEVNSRLKRVREELAVIDEQLAALAEAADEARIRYLVSETPLADRELRDARRHADAMARSRGSVVDSIVELERAQDELLERLVIETH